MIDLSSAMWGNRAFRRRTGRDDRVERFGAPVVREREREAKRHAKCVARRKMAEASRKANR